MRIIAEPALESLTSLCSNPPVVTKLPNKANVVMVSVDLRKQFLMTQP